MKTQEEINALEKDVKYWKAIAESWESISKSEERWADHYFNMWTKLKMKMKKKK